MEAVRFLVIPYIKYELLGISRVTNVSTSFLVRKSKKLKLQHSLLLLELEFSTSAKGAWHPRILDILLHNVLG